MALTSHSSIGAHQEKPMPAVLTPEDRARIEIDRKLEAAGWTVQTYGPHDLINYPAVAIREFPLTTGRADYLLVVNKKAIGVVEAKAVGITLSGITHQSHNYSQGISNRIKAWNNPLRFLYQSTGVETIFRDEADPEPRSRGVFTFHRPETLEAWAKQSPTLRGRLRKLPDIPLPTDRLWDPQQRAIRGLEWSLAQDKPNALIQMATGSGKTYTAISEIYRLIKYGDARRIL